LKVTCILPHKKSEIRSTKSETNSKPKIQNKQETTKGMLKFVMGIAPVNGVWNI